MKRELYSKSLQLRQVRVTDDFWKQKIELVRTEVIPYQWDALNDRVEGAAPSYCMRNFKVAGNMARRKEQEGAAYVAPAYTFRGFEALPEDPANPDPDKFYGFVFQDSDFSKWIEAVGYSLTQHPDPVLEKTADEAIDIVCAAQQEDGYLDTYYIINGRDKTFSNLKDHHELYCFGHLTEGAVAYYEATGKDKLLNAARRFADYVADKFGLEEGKCNGYPGHEIAEMALVRLYEVTGDRKYFDLSKYFVDERGKRPYYFDGEEAQKMLPRAAAEEERYAYYQAHKPVRHQEEAVGHAVRAVYLYSGMTDVARISGDDALIEACRKLWDSVVNEKMYITGGIGATHIGESFSFPYDLPNDTAYAETCASIGMAFWARRMLEVEPDSRYADVLEREIYNGILSGIALDGKSFFYVNPLEVLPEACHRDERKAHVKSVRQKWFGCACCPPNLARFVSSIGSYAYTERANTLFVHLYVGGEIEKNVNGRKVSINVTTGLPWNGASAIIVKAAGTDLTLALRIPDWCEGQYEMKGFDGTVTEEKGYLYLTKEWGDEETITLDFPMEVKLLEASDAVRENIGKVAVMRGPVVYCLEEADNGKDLHLLKVLAENAPEVAPFAIDGNPANSLILKGSRIEKTNSGLYRKAAEKKETPVDLTYIPYFMWANRGENEMQVWTAVKE